MQKNKINRSKTTQKLNSKATITNNVHRKMLQIQQLTHQYSEFLNSVSKYKYNPQQKTNLDLQTQLRQYQKQLINLQQNMRKQIKILNNYKEQFDYITPFLQKQKLLNINNFIGKYQQTVDEIQYLKEKYNNIDRNAIEVRGKSFLFQQIKNSSQILTHNKDKKINLQNKNNKIQYELMLAKKDIKKISAQIYDYQIKIRNFEKMHNNCQINRKFKQKYKLY